MPALLEVTGLTVEFATRRGVVRAVEKVDLAITKGETLGIVGESGSGKSVTSYAVMQILDRAGHIAEGTVRFCGTDLRAVGERDMRRLRGREISMIFQNPRAALNPIRRVGRQIEDVLKQHLGVRSSDAKGGAIAILRQVRIARAEERYHSYPFELSGGMCQRIVIALALACQPQLLIADEPTTGLDVTTQRAIMELIVELTRERGMSTILITHDLGLASAYCDKVVVMEQGHVVEAARSATIFRSPAHRYTRKLVRATPRPGIALRDLLPDEAAAPLPAAAPPIDGAPLLEVDGLTKEYDRRTGRDGWASIFAHGSTADDGRFRAVDGIGFTIMRGESVGLVGESGCGKSTTSMMVMRLLDPTAGRILFDGQDIGAIPARRFARSSWRKRIQMVFQDPTDSLNPRFTAARSIADPLLRLGNYPAANLRARIEELAALVGLPNNLLERFPHQLSGGQKARVGIARAIALNPELVVLDEPTAALDVSVQAVVLNLLSDLKAALGVSYLFVSHDLHVVQLLCDRVIVMRQGRVVESGDARHVFHSPQSDYTRELIAAIPHPPV